MKRRRCVKSTPVLSRKMSLSVTQISDVIELTQSTHIYFGSVYFLSELLREYWMIYRRYLRYVITGERLIHIMRIHM